MRKYVVTFLAALMLLLGGGIANASTPVPITTANGTATTSVVPQKVSRSYSVAANNECHTGYSYGYYTSSRGYTYRLDPANITKATPWCISSNNARLVIQNNGDLTLWDSAIRGGRLIWHSAVSANRNAYFLSFQNDGNIVIYTYKMEALWASNTSCNSISGFTAWTVRIERSLPTDPVHWSTRPSGVCDSGAGY